MNLAAGGKPARAVKHYRVDVEGDDVKLGDDGLPPAALVRAVYKAFVENDACVGAQAFRPLTAQQHEAVRAADGVRRPAHGLSVEARHSAS